MSLLPLCIEAEHEHTKTTFSGGLQCILHYVGHLLPQFVSTHSPIEVGLLLYTPTVLRMDSHTHYFY